MSVWRLSNKTEQQRNRADKRGGEMWPGFSWTDGEACASGQWETTEKAFHHLGHHRAGTLQTSASTQGWRKGGVSHCRGTPQPPSLVLLHHGPPHTSQEMDSPGCSPHLGQQQLSCLCSTPKMWRCSDMRALGMPWSLQDLLSVERSPDVTW